MRVWRCSVSALRRRWWSPWWTPGFRCLKGMKTSDLEKSTAALLGLAKGDFEAIEPFRSDRFFKRSDKVDAHGK